MKVDPLPQNTTQVTLQTVLDRLSADRRSSPTRKRDLRSALTCFAGLVGQLPAAIPVDLAAIRQSLDRMVPVRAKISAKRWANLRSDLAAAIGATGLQPMLKTADVKPDESWSELLTDADKWVRHALSKLSRWATLRGIAPENVDDGVSSSPSSTPAASSETSVTAPASFAEPGASWSHSMAVVCGWSP